MVKKYPMTTPLHYQCVLGVMVLLALLVTCRAADKETDQIHNRFLSQSADGKPLNGVMGRLDNGVPYNKSQEYGLSVDSPSSELPEWRNRKSNN